VSLELQAAAAVYNKELPNTVAQYLGLLHLLHCSYAAAVNQMLQ
jgi:hypothetical protein